MLPGVEVARRRRVRGADMPEAGGGGLSGSYETNNNNRYSRASGTVAHHHHHHHHHHQASRNPPRPGTPRPGSGSLVRRMQDILHEHRPRSIFQQVNNSSSERASVVERAVSPLSGSNRSSRGPAHNRSGDSESRIAPLSSLWRRSSSDSNSNLRGAALEARNRLDERLRAAARASQSRPGWQSVQSSYGMNLLFSDDEDENPWSDEDGWESSFQEWLAAWAPSAFEERWGRTGSSSSNRTSNNSRTMAFKPRLSEGLSKAAINALPIHKAGTQIGGARSTMEQEECPVCLEKFLTGQYLMALPCNHRFHPECLTPWLTSHGQCPYCRADIVQEKDGTEQKSNDRPMGGSNREFLPWVETLERGMDRPRYS